MNPGHWSRNFNPLPAAVSADPARDCRILVQLADAAGIDNPVEMIQRVLERDETLGRVSQTAVMEARRRQAAADDQLFRADPLDAAALERYAEELREVAPWLDADLRPDSPDPHASAAMQGLARVRRRVRNDAAAQLTSIAGGLYLRFTQAAQVAVDAVRQLDPLPANVWGAADDGVAAATLGKAGRGGDWLALLENDWRFQAAHDGGRYLRHLGIGSEGILDDAPRLGFTFRNWAAAQADLQQLRNVPETLRLRRAVELGWEPGVWSASDLRNVDQGPRRKLLAAFRR